jgi:dTDP-4-dehydrorhamnose 3,5-epimerase
VRVETTPVPGVLVIEPVVHRDSRGFFLETWRAERYADAGLPAAFVQDNHSRSARGTLRGLHYQVEVVQGKLVRCSLGEVYDVAVDLRRGSPTYGRWVGVTLSDRDHRQLWIPPGCAHERVIRWDDPELAIAWPLHGEAPLVSPRDAAGLAFRDAPACG